MKYKEITLPGGIFRQYEDRPNVWVQVLEEGEKSLVDKIVDAFESGRVKKDNN
jgi:hypothetical protein